MKIYKYILESKEPHILYASLPSRAKIIHTNTQGEDLCVWAEVEESDTKHKLQYFGFYLTGQEIPPERSLYLGTIHLPGPLVFHIYEIL